MAEYIDIVGIKQAVNKGKMQAFVRDGSIYLQCKISGECVKIGDAPAADVAPVVRCVECAKAIPHKYSPHFYKCGGCSYLRGRLVGRLFGCTAGKRKDGGEEDAV